MKISFDGIKILPANNGFVIEGKELKKGKFDTPDYLLDYRVICNSYDELLDELCRVCDGSEEKMRKFAKANLE